MALRKPGLIALFDVDGTLTAPRKVSNIFVPNLLTAALVFSDFGSVLLRLKELRNSLL